MVKKIFIIAGEESGDNIGSKLMSQIKSEYPDYVIKGVGGNKMTREGLISQFPMQEIALMGFFEVLPHLPNIMKRIKQTVADIVEFAPDYVVTIDSPGFNYQVAKRLRKLKFAGKLIHYVAPTVWAYKEKRAKKTAKLFDKLLCILPWEPPYFEKEGLDAKFVGHPIFEDMTFLNSKEKEELRQNYLIGKQDVVISCLVGSRLGEVKKFAKIYAESLHLLQRKIGALKIFILSTENMEGELKSCLDDFPEGTAIISDQKEKSRILQMSNAAIVKSGTVGLEVASYKCPHVICYKVNRLSYMMIKAMIKTKFVNLVNISAGREVIPELIQEDFTATNIQRNMIALLDGKNIASEQVEMSQIELQKMGLKSKNVPSKNAVLEIFSA